MTDKSDFTAAIPLKQHSPLIHFQAHDQMPLIRISELRPLINRFLKQYLRGFDRQIFHTYKKCLDNYFPENEKRASAYKINACSHAVMDKTLYKQGKKRVKDTAYFGDYHQLEYTGLTLSLFSYRKEIIALLKTIIPVVLSCFNLGSRKSKGFGSFTPVYMKEEEFTQNLVKLYKKKNIFVKNNIPDFRAEINETYQLLKSGINWPYKKRYNKSKLYDYFIQKGIQWEKAALKRAITARINEKGYPWLALRNTSGRHPENNNSDTPCSFVRALLGLAGHYNFLNNEKKPQWQYDVTVDHKEIKRIPSPVLFKVFQNSLYAIAVWDFYKEEYDTILDKTFSFTIMNNKIKKIKSGDDVIHLNLKTPQEFDLQYFLTGSLLKMGYATI